MCFILSYKVDRRHFFCLSAAEKAFFLQSLVNLPISSVQCASRKLLNLLESFYICQSEEVGEGENENQSKNEGAREREKHPVSIIGC